jgi:hypothetical protein
MDGNISDIGQDRAIQPLYKHEGVLTDPHKWMIWFVKQAATTVQ